MTADRNRARSGQVVVGSVEHWLLAALDPELRDTALTQWDAGQSVQMPLGELFSVARLPQALIVAHNGTRQDLATTDEIVAEMFEGGPVICDPCQPARWYALVPTLTSLWRANNSAWRKAGVTVLGEGRYLSVPPVQATAYDPRTNDPYWAVPVSLPGDLCRPEHVDRLIASIPNLAALETES